MKPQDFPTKPRLSLWTLLLSSVFFLLFIVWLGFYQVEEVTKVSGFLEPTIGSAPIQFPGAGVISELSVTEGQQVKQGEVLMRLESVNTAETLESLKEQIRILTAQKLRLTALARNLPLRMGTFEVERPSLAANQRQLYDGEIASYQASLEVYRSQKNSLDLQIREKKAEQTSLDKEIQLAREELDIQKSLAKEGMASRTQLIGLERQFESLVSRQTALPLSIQQLQEDLQGVALKQDEFVKNHYREYQKTLTQIGEQLAILEAQASSGEKTQQLLALTSPIDGQVSGLKKRRTGETIAAGELLMEIIPSKQRFLAQLKIPTKDIGYLRAGLPVNVILDAYDREPRATLKGTLESLSIASQLDEKGVPSYRATVLIEEKEVTIHRGNFPLLSGMSLKSQIFTGRRTMLEFIFNSVIRSSGEAFKER